MTGRKDERRKAERYRTEVEIYFDFAYDIETKVKFELIDRQKEKALSRKYSAVSRNVSIEGLCFVSRKKVEQGDLLHLEVYLPAASEPIHMKGEVKWCRPVPPSPDASPEDKKIQCSFETGVKLMLVNGEPVHKSIHHDQAYGVDWSIVLESVFGSYRMLMEGKFKSQSK